jgi:prepilin-type N-terminal cleavage/methylation domain-containing protein
MHARIDDHQPDGETRVSGAARGFTLIEMALAIFIIALLLGSILIPLATQVEQRQISDTQKTLEEIKEALIGYAVAKGNLPCPDTGTNGTENVEGGGTGRCDPAAISGLVAIGRVPYSDLGVGNSDLWGNRFTYVVNEQFARRAGTTYSPFTLSTAGNDVQICATAACVAAAKLSTTAVFAVVSHGKNGFGAMKLATGATNPASGSADEQENYDTDANIVTRPQFTGGPAASEFDDIVIWLSRYTLFNRMVAAGKLP